MKICLHRLLTADGGPSKALRFLISSMVLVTERDMKKKERSTTGHFCTSYIYRQYILKLIYQ